MEDHYSVEEVAFALETSLKTVLRSLRAGEMKGIKCGRSWSIPKSALRDWIFSAIGIPSNQTTCKKYNCFGIKAEQNRGQTSSVNWYRYRGTLDQDGSVEALEPRRAAVLLQKTFRFHAKRLAPRDPATQDDLVQEMSLAVLRCQAAGSRGYFIERAKSRASNYLKRQEIRSMAPLSELKRHPTMPEPVKDVALCRLLADAGISVSEMAAAAEIRISPDVELDRQWMQEKLSAWKGSGKNGSVLISGFES